MFFLDIFSQSLEDEDTRERSSVQRVWKQVYSQRLYSFYTLIAAPSERLLYIFIEHMNYTFSCCNQFNPLGNHFFQLFCLSQQYVQPTTIIVANSQPQESTESKVDSFPKMLPTQTSICERSLSPEPKQRTKKETKPVRKELTRKKD